MLFNKLIYDGKNRSKKFYGNVNLEIEIGQDRYIGTEIFYIFEQYNNKENGCYTIDRNTNRFVLHKKMMEYKDDFFGMYTFHGDGVYYVNHESKLGESCYWDYCNYISFQNYMTESEIQKKLDKMSFQLNRIESMLEKIYYSPTMPGFYDAQIEFEKKLPFKKRKTLFEITDSGSFTDSI
jgi:hypothetical protein